MALLLRARTRHHLYTPFEPVFVKRGAFLSPVFRFHILVLGLMSFAGQILCPAPALVYTEMVRAAPAEAI